MDARVYKDDFEFQSCEGRFSNAFDVNVIEVSVQVPSMFVAKVIDGLVVTDIAPVENK